MPTAKLPRILAQLRSLNRDEREQVRAELDALMAPSAPCADEELARRLLEGGVLSEVKPPITDLTPYRNRRPVQVTGRPLSEILIEERR